MFWVLKLPALTNCCDLAGVHLTVSYVLVVNFQLLYAGGKLLLELNRVLRPGGFFVWSATPVYQKLPEDVGIWSGRL